MQKIKENKTTNNGLTHNETERYSRHLVIPEVGEKGQVKLKNAKVLLIGAGGLGSPIAMYLAAAGIGKIGIVDFDVVSLSNLQRQVLFSTSETGHLKTEQAKQRLFGINPNIEVVTFETRFNRDNAFDILEDFDIIADGSDNFATRYLVNDACVIKKKPFVYGSIFRFEGQVSFFEPVNGPCYRCLFPEPPGLGESPSCEEGGVIGVLPGIIGSLQAAEVIKYFLGRGELLTGRLLTMDALDMKFREMKFAKNPDCPVCGTNPEIKELADYEEFCGNSSTNNLKDKMTDNRNSDITVTGYKAKLDNGEKPFLLDVREQYETEIASIGGHLIPLGELRDRLKELPEDKETELIVYCRTGSRSHHAAVYLREECGYKNVKNLIGGIYAWHDEIDASVQKY